MNILIIRTIAIEEDCSKNLYNNQGIGLATELSRMGHMCGLVYYAKKGHERTEIINSDGMELKVYHISGRNLIWNAIYDNVLYRICEKYDVIQVSECDQICSWQVYKRFSKKTIIYHGPYKSQYTKKYNLRSKVFDMAFSWRAGFKNAKVITKSRLAENYLKNKGFQDIITLGVGLNESVLNMPAGKIPHKLEQLINKKDNYKYLLYIGALSKRKNLMFLLHVLENLINKKGHKNYKLIIAGDKAYKEEEYFNNCFSYIKKKGLNQNVIYLGTIEQKYLKFLYNTSDLYLLATQYDIFGMVYLEAMYFGTPILTTECGGSSLLVEDGRTGYIQKAGDIEAWSRSAEKIIEDTEGNKYIRENERELIQNNYLWSSLAPQFLEVYNEVIARNRENIILADCESEEIQEFAEGLQSVIGDRIFINSKICNGGRSKLANIRRYLIYICYPVYFIIRNRRYKYVIGWQQFFALFYVFYCRLFHIRKTNIVVAVNFTYKTKPGFTGKIYKKFMDYCVKSKYLDYIHVPSYNYAKICAKEFGVPQGKFLVTPFGLPDTYEKWRETKVEYNNYSFSIGRSNRDFNFLIDAWEQMPEDELLVIASDTFCPKKALPVNVIHRRDITGDAQFAYIANCKTMIIPIDDGTVCSGDTVLLKAMSYKKLVIVTVPSTLGEMYIEDGINGLLVKKELDKFAGMILPIINSDSAGIIGTAARKSFLKRFSRYAMGKNIGQLLR